MCEIREVKKDWLSTRFWTSLEKSRLVPEDRSKQSLTNIPTQLMEKILTCLNDEDLERGRLTCHFFHRGFFKHFKGTKIEKGKIKTIMNYANLGYNFNSIENVSLKHSFHIFERKLLRHTSFPLLRALKLEYLYNVGRPR